MSGWISSGLRHLVHYFGAEEHEAAATSSTPAQHDNYNDDGDDWSTEENRSSGNKRKADCRETQGDTPPDVQSTTGLSAVRVKRGRLENGTPADETQLSSKVEPAATANDATKDSLQPPAEDQLDPSFQRHLEELKEFKAEHGHTNVSYEATAGAKRKTLYAWVGFQRSRRKAFPGRYKTKRIMSQAEIDALDAIGFEWDIRERDYTSVTRPDTFWKTMELLKEYKKKHGHTNVPFDPTGQDTMLYNFVLRQRERRKALPNRYLRGRVMVQAEIDALDAIGFEWMPPPLEHTPKNSFWEKVEELKEFKQKNGHLKLRYNKTDSTTESQLYSWTLVQRKRYKALPKRHLNYFLITPDEVAALDSVGFEWEKPPVVQPAYKPYFWERLEELKAYKIKHGHIRLRAEHPLYDFCALQKLRYKAFPKRYRENSPMMQDEKDALKDIGFEVWTNPKRK